MKKSKKIKKIVLAKQDKITQFEIYVNKVLRALRHPEALVTDESLVCDFLDIWDHDERVKILQKAQRKLMVSIASGDYIWEVAARISSHKQHKEK